MKLISSSSSSSWGPWWHRWVDTWHSFILMSLLIDVLNLIGPWGIWLQSQISRLQTHFKDKYLKYFLWNCCQVNATTPHWSLVNIGSGNGLVPSGQCWHRSMSPYGITRSQWVQDYFFNDRGPCHICSWIYSNPETIKYIYWSANSSFSSSWHIFTGFFLKSQN